MVSELKAVGISHNRQEDCSSCGLHVLEVKMKFLISLKQTRGNQCYLIINCSFNLNIQAAEEILSSLPLFPSEIKLTTGVEENYYKSYEVATRLIREGGKLFVTKLYSVF